ncbi:MAG: hypothetical protein M0C28_42115 [Candidatus Moduliflexus flocculans]|nr:hypothetical protein [Candidatus Moduliflexus flocculans]
MTWPRIKSVRVVRRSKAGIGALYGIVLGSGVGAVAGDPPATATPIPANRPSPRRVSSRSAAWLGLVIGVVYRRLGRTRPHRSSMSRYGRASLGRLTPEAPEIRHASRRRGNERSHPSNLPVSCYNFLSDPEEDA